MYGSPLFAFRHVPRVLSVDTSTRHNLQLQVRTRPSEARGKPGTAREAERDSKSAGLPEHTDTAAGRLCAIQTEQKSGCARESAARAYRKGAGNFQRVYEP